MPPDEPKIIALLVEKTSISCHHSWRPWIFLPLRQGRISRFCPKPRTNACPSRRYGSLRQETLYIPMKPTDTSVSQRHFRLHTRQKYFTKTDNARKHRYGNNNTILLHGFFPKITPRHIFASYYNGFNGYINRISFRFAMLSGIFRSVSVEMGVYIEVTFEGF